MNNDSLVLVEHALRLARTTVKTFPDRRWFIPNYSHAFHSFNVVVVSSLLSFRVNVLLSFLSCVSCIFAAPAALLQFEEVC